MKPTLLRAAFTASILFASQAPANDSWTQIPVPLEQYTVTVDHQDKQIRPSCAFGQPYSFYLKPGKTDKLLVYFNGGGACWNYGTCAITPGGRPSYLPSTDAANNPNTMAGLLDVKNPDNPYKDWTMVFLPYCTGDIFLGSKDTTYQNPLNPADSTDSVSVHHHGYDNFLYVMNYLRQQRLDRAKALHLSNDDSFPKKVLVTGFSAGSYGATLNYPWLKKIVAAEHTKVSLISDGGVGVITDGFLRTGLFGPDSSWYIDQNLHSLFDTLQNQNGANFLPQAYRLLATRYQYDRFAQYTTAYDAVQKLFWDMMLASDGLAPYGYSDWNEEMTRITGGLENSLPRNYRAYIDPGCNHTILRFNEFYSSSRQGISFIDWTTAMTGENYASKTDWQNLSCTPGVDCGEESLTRTGIESCLDRTFNVP